MQEGLKTILKFLRAYVRWLELPALLTSLAMLKDYSLNNEGTLAAAALTLISVIIAFLLFIPFQKAIRLIQSYKPNI